VRHVYHVPEQTGPAVGPESDAAVSVSRAVEAAVIRGVARAVRDLIGDGAEPAGRVVPLVRPPTRRPAGPASAGRDGPEQDGADGDPRASRFAAVPSYQDKGKPVSVPVAPGTAGGGTPAATGTAGAGTAGSVDASPAGPHPLVRAVNEVAVLVRRAEQAPPRPIVTAPPGAGIFGRMWARGLAQDSARVLQRPSREDLEATERLLIKAVSAKALEIAQVLLNRNEVVVRREAAKYGEPNATVPGSPAVRLRAAAGEMAALQRQILDHVRDFGNAQAAAVPGAPQAGLRLEASHFDDILEGSFARSDAHVQQALLPRYETLKRIYGAEFPILLGRNLDLAQFAVADPARLARAIGTTTDDVLKSIADLRKRLTEESVWQLGPVLEAARNVMGVIPGTPAAAALDQYLADRKRDEFIRQLLITALGITLAIGATLATGGAAAPGAAAGVIALAGGLSLATAGVSVYGAVEHYESYTFERAASHSSLDAATALAHEDPSLAWLVVSVIGAVVDVGTAVVAVRNLSRLAKVAMLMKDLGALEQAARAQAKVLAAEGRLAGTEEEFVQAVLRSARQRIGGAASVLKYGEFIFRRNPGGPRTLAEAVAIAEAHGVEIGDDVLIRLEGSLGKDTFASYGNDVLSTDRVTWDKLTGTIGKPSPGATPTYWTAEPIVQPTKVMAVRLRPDVLESDEAIVAVLMHEMHEINWLRDRLEGGVSITAAEFRRLINGTDGTLHLEAWRVALDLVRKMRGG